MGLCWASAALGLLALALILGALLWNGFAGLSLDVFTKMTPPPGQSGGLLNAIVGSLIMTFFGVLIGAPLGLLAGTYMAEYGRNSKLTTVVRFINDVLLSRAVHRDRPVRLRDHRRADGPFLGHRRRHRAGAAGRAGGGAHHRGHAQPGARPVARGRVRAGPAALAGHPPRRLQGGAGGPASPACCWRWPASAARPRRCCSPL